MNTLSLSGVYRAALTGEYPVRELQTAQRTFLALSIGTSRELNRQIIELGLERAEGHTLWTDENGAGLVNATQEGIEIVRGLISNKLLGKRPGTVGIVKALTPGANPEHRPVLEIVTHAHLAGRVALQALLAGWEPALSPGMPRWFDAESEQVWTRSKWAWVPYEWAYLLGITVKHQKQMRKLMRQGMLHL